MKQNKLFRELDLNTDPIETIEIYAAKKVEETGQERIDTINANPGVRWITPEVVNIQTIKDCAEIIEARRQHNTLPFKLAKAILKLIKQPATRNVVEKKKRQR